MDSDRERNTPYWKLMRKGCRHLRHFENEEARDCFNKVLLSNPDDVAAVFNKGRALFALAGAIEKGDKGVEDRDEIALIAIDKFREALQCLRILKRNNSGMHITLVSEYLSIGFAEMLSGRHFEYFTGALYIEKGYKVELTKESRDNGVDGFLKKADKVLAMEAKRRFSGGIQVKDVEKLIRGKEFYEKEKGCESCTFVTNSHFSEEATELGNKKGVELIDGDALESMLLNLYRV